MKVHSPYWPEASIFRRFFLSFFFFYLSFFLSLSFSKRNGLSNRCMYRDDWYIGWQTDTGGIRPLASVYLWSDITTADRRACESDLPLEMAFDRRVVPRIDNQGLRDYCSHFPLDLFSLFRVPLNPFPLFLCFPLIPWDRSMRHALCVRLLCSVWGSVWWWAERKNRIFIVIQICWARFSFS